MLFCGVIMFIPVLYKLWYWQISRHDELEKKAVQQQTSELSVSAERGTIYDASGNILAISSSAYDVILSPKGIDERQQRLPEIAQKAQREIAQDKEKGKEISDLQYQLAKMGDTNLTQLISEGLSEILEGTNAADIAEKCKDVNSQYKKIASKIDVTTEEKVRDFISRYNLASCIYLSPNAKRYYPYSTLAAQVIGFTNDNGGAYGIEAQFNDELAGKAGLVVTAHNGSGTDLKNFYQDYFDPVDGSNATLTIDANIQKLCEDALESGIQRYDVRNGGFIIAMECDTGAILGMATSPTYNLNNYSDIVDSILKQGVENGTMSQSDALNEMWRNKALNDTYEPGSTFKSIVLASALEEGLTNENSTYNCSGSIKVANWTIKCSNHNGHGKQTLAEAVGHSCNPAFITIGQSVGADLFYSYMERFGLMESTGIDLPGEGSNVIWSKDDFGITQLATASFGQRFTVTPISLITAINAVVNGGYLYTPHVVDKIVDSNGETTYQADTTPVRQVISKKTSARCAKILEGVVTSFTGKNAYVSGYRIGGKTGTSQTLVDDEYITSFMGFAPADQPQVIVLVAFDSPKVNEAGSDYSTTGYYISGGNMAAPIAGQLISEILDYRGFEKEYTSNDLAGANVTVPSLIGCTEDEAEEKLRSKDLDYRKAGTGETVTGQCPESGTSIPSGSQVILYMGEKEPTEKVKMPNLESMTIEEARAKLNALNLYMTAVGSSSYYSGTTLAYKQSIPAGEMVKQGTVVEVSFRDTINDYAGREINE